jgi:hypothetical protein
MSFSCCRRVATFIETISSFFPAENVERCQWIGPPDCITATFTKKKYLKFDENLFSGKW